MNEFLTFRKMITPVFIQIIFWVGTAIIAISGLVTMFSGGSRTTTVNSPFGGPPITQTTSGGGGFFLGLLIMVIGPIMWRVYCELLIVIFKIHSELVAIRGAANPGGAGFPVIPPQ
jgi:hypothetical protein